MLRFLLCLLLLAPALSAQRPPPRISEDRELKEFDLSGWDCLDRPEGTAKTPDGAERNRQKNRPYVPVPGTGVKDLDFAGFLRHVAPVDLSTRGLRRKEISAAQRALLEPLEKQIVSLTGYLVLAYSGPPESTNCGSVDFHDWHLEIFEQPQDHPPRVGDPTPIIAEIAPRTQTELFRSGIRLQDLAAFIRAPDLTHEPTGKKAARVRVTGYLLWDDDHNGRADIGERIERTAANGYHNPWRRTAWEIHPILKIEVLDGTAAVGAAPGTPPPAAPSPSVAAQFITITQPVTLKIPYGETTLPRGLRLPVVKSDAETVTVEYMGKRHLVPRASTAPTP